MLFMHALAMKELLIGVKWYMNEVTRCVTVDMSLIPKPLPHIPLNCHSFTKTQVTYKYLHIHAHTHTCIHKYIHTYIHGCTHIYMHAFIHLSIKIVLKCS